MNLKDKPSDVLEQALEELEKCENDPFFYIDMNDWVYPHADGDKCSVCLAGVLMVMGQDIKNLHTPQSPAFNFPNEAHKLHAVDAFRAGRIWAGIASFNDPKYTLLAQPPRVEGIPQYYSIDDYNDSPSLFKVAIRDVIAMLRKIDQ